MPANIAPSSGPQRTSRSLLNDRESKRARGEISCAECRRLKLKCDKQVPCGTCVRRGCSNICPNGKLTGGHGSRLILADTEKLHRKIAEMSDRIRQLEDALAVLQANTSKERHPLLGEEFKNVKFWPEPVTEAPEQPDYDPIAETVDALGTLTISETGEAKYYGRSAGSEALLFARESQCIADDFRTDPYKPGQYFFSTIPFALRSDLEALPQRLDDSLPPLPRAWALCELFFEHASWYFRPVRREELVDEVMTPIYNVIKQKDLSESDPSVAKPTPLGESCPHKMALLYMVFSIGALVDLTLSAYNEEAHQYFEMGRAALALRSIAESPSIETIQAMSLTALYHSMSGERSSVERSWITMSLCARLSHSIGLHRDCARWGLDAKTIQKRRYVFWEIYAADLVLNLHVGRPPSTHLSYADCEFPLDDEPTLNEQGEPEAGFFAWRYIVSKQQMGPVLERLVSTKPTRYEDILELDRVIRQSPPPKSLKPKHKVQVDYEDPPTCLKHWLVSHMRFTTMLYLHRSYFTQALLDHPKNPLLSPFAPSYLAAYRVSSAIITTNTDFHSRCPLIFARIGSFWTHMFSASIILGFVVTRTPKSTMAPHAFAQLCLAFDVFEKGAETNVRAQRFLAVLRKMKDKACTVFSQTQTQTDYTKPRPPTSLRAEFGVVDDGNDDLSLFGGQTRVLSSNLLSKRWVNRSRNSRLASASTSTTPTDTNLEASSSAGQAMPEPGSSTPSQSEDSPSVQPSVEMDQFADFSPLAWAESPWDAAFAQWPQPFPSFSPNFPPPPDFSQTQQQPIQQSEPSILDLDPSPSMYPIPPNPGYLSFDSLPGQGAAASPFFGGLDMRLPIVAPGDDEQWMKLMRESGLLDDST
ncbi:hypothetical protein JAAARDRAFT_30847 [Jaapia argillacea MUCL 33604]|uniref:Zn(2)-C6 fungal-type domain-containing protein n=1 Tax=Jaapia argillacea MUCL 33604 TaxID=933084 RepID=A0A067QFM8_9AGAM|nr:hypothetical protein JAAARDRAFT_30847 [Jaapia argillacea MUCL 33604]